MTITFSGALQGGTSTTPITVAAGGTGVVTITGIVKGNGTSAMSAATVRIDYAESTAALATGIIKSTTSTGAHSIAVSGTDYAPGTSALATGIIKSTTTTGALSTATAGTDYSGGTSALATGILKSTITTGALSIAVAGDFPTLNQSTSGTAAGLSATLAASSGGTGVANNVASTWTISGNYATTHTVPGAYTYTYPGATSTLAQLGANTFTAAQTLPAAGSIYTGTSSGSTTLTAGAAASGTAVLPFAGGNIGYLEIPQNSQSTGYTAVLSDSGKHLLHPSADTTIRTFTIPANSSVVYPIGTALTFINQASAGVLTIAITSDIMRLAGAGTTGSRTLAANGIATAIKLTSTEWIISGTGLT